MTLVTFSPRTGSYEIELVHAKHNLFFVGLLDYPATLVEMGNGQQGLVGDKKLSPIAYRLPLGDKHKFLSTYHLPVGDRC